MPIAFRCACGASIRLPESAAGKKARCKKCQHIFTVPTTPPSSSTMNAEPVHEVEPSQVPAEPTPMATEPAAMSDHPSPAEPRTVSMDDLLYDLAEEEPVAPPLRKRPSPVPPMMENPPGIPPVQIEMDDEDADGTNSRSFMEDVVRSLLFFTEPGNLVSWVMVTFVTLIPIGFIGPMFFAGVYVAIGIQGYIATFYLSIIRETAGGEDDLPNPNFSSLWEFVSSIFEYWGATLLVAMPCLAWKIYAWVTGRNDDGQVSLLLEYAGAFFWPAVILMVAIGGGFRALWPPTLVVRTILASPLPYLVVVGLLVGSDVASERIMAAMDGKVAVTSLTSAIILKVVLEIISMYVTIIGMKAVGLYYRHFKDRFPWSGE